MNATEIIEALGKGIGDIGISGKDLWRESEQSIQSNIALAKEYNWGKSDLVVAVDNMWLDCVNPTDLEDISYEFYQKKKRLIRCSTKFKNLGDIVVTLIILIFFFLIKYLNCFLKNFKSLNLISGLILKIK